MPDIACNHVAKVSVEYPVGVMVDLYFDEDGSVKVAVITDVTNSYDV